MRKTFTFAAALCCAMLAQAQVVTFENVDTFEGDLVLNADNYQQNFMDEDETEGMFISGDFAFHSYYMADWDFFCGFAISARTETTFTTTTPDQFNSCVGHGANGSQNYAVFYDAGSMMPPQTIESISEEDTNVSGFYVTNTAWVVKAILEGDGYSDAFTTGDFLKLTVTGTNAAEESKSVEVYLADYTSENEADHYYLADWTWVDLSALGAVQEISFAIDGSKKNSYGLTTPTYFCMDDFNGVPSATLAVADFEDIEIGEEGHMSVSNEEDDDRTEFVSGSFEFATGCISDWDYWYWFGYANRTDTKYETLDDQWNNIVGGGHNGSANYGVAYAAVFNGPCRVTVLSDEAQVVPGFYITNSSWAYNSMLTGADAKKFGDGDWFKLTITGYDADGEETGTKDFYLADLRDASTAYIINDWRYVDLSGLGAVKTIGFALSSTDNGDWGMNTPAYFCFDDFGAEGVEELPESNVTTGVTEISNLKPQTSNRFDLSGRQAVAGQKGLIIVRQADGSVRKVVKK